MTTLTNEDLIARVRQHLDDDEVSSVYACHFDRDRVKRAVAWRCRVVDDYEHALNRLRRADEAEPQAIAEDDEDAPDEFGCQHLTVEVVVLRRVLTGMLSEYEVAP